MHIYTYIFIKVNSLKGLVNFLFVFVLTNKLKTDEALI